MNAPCATGSTIDPACHAEGFSFGSLRACGLMLGAIAAFQIAFEIPGAGVLVLAYAAALLELRRLGSPRQAFYAGLLTGLGVFVPQTLFLWTIFGPIALVLCLILAFFHAVFVLALNSVQARWGTRWALMLAPVLWCGIEYFRSEVWWLRFTWFTAASPLIEHAGIWAHAVGIYGLGFVAFLVAAVMARLGNRPPLRRGLLFGAGVVGLFLMGSRIGGFDSAPVQSNGIRVAGIQMEFPGVPEVVMALNRLAQTHPDAELVMLSEYTFDGPVPDSVRAWCRKHRKWLVAGGKEPNPAAFAAGGAFAGGTDTGRTLGVKTGSEDRHGYFNTAFVISTNGEVVFSQAKSRPIQFFADGAPATRQRLWNSPWGPLGIAICYDLSYRQVMDRLVELGATALLIPTMDVETWGEREHRLNARMARVRAAEYGIPIFRVASSGVSQLVDPSGRETATAPVPGPGAVIAGTLFPRDLTHRPATIPWDRWFAPACSLVAGLILAALCIPGKHALARSSHSPS